MHVLICGQVRNEAVFRAAVARLQKARANGAIDRMLFSTWQGEVARYEGLSEYLAAAAVEVVETLMPTEHMEATGNYFYQVTQITSGLERFEPEDFIFKTRGDVQINFGLGFRASKLSWERRERERPVAEGPFRHRIAVGRASPVIPFWFEDRYLYGACADLRTMARLSRSGDILWNPHTAIAETRLYAGIFVETFPVIRHFMRIFWMMRTLPHDPKVFQNEVVYRSLALYHHIVDMFFTVGLEPHCVDYTAFAGTIQPPPEPAVPVDDPLTAAYRAQPAYLETRAIIAAEGLAYLSRPAVTTWFRKAVEKLGQDNLYRYHHLTLPRLV